MAGCPDIVRSNLVTAMGEHGPGSGLVSVQFRVLGPLEARFEDRPVPLAGPQQRLLLAALLAEANRVVSADRLIDILWHDEVPAEDAPTRLAKAVYRLRACFGAAGAAQVLVTHSPGYSLSVASDGLDSVRFAVMLAEGQGLLESDPRRALERLDSALALWRGPAWVDVADHEFIRPEVARLEGLRAVAAEERGEAMLALGRHAELVPELTSLTQQYPLRERPRAQLMVALYRTGRQAEAVAVYRSFRRYLRDELGLEPSAGLQRVERDILRQRAATGMRSGRAAVEVLPNPAGDILSAPAQRFVGRRQDLEWLDVLFDRAASGQPPVLAIVTGGAGVGKTCLVQEFARLVRARGGKVLIARCDEHLGVAKAVLAAAGAAWDTPADGAVEGTRRRIETALAALGDAPVLIVVDDLDADRAESRDVLSLLAALRVPPAVMVVGTCRADAGELVDGAEYVTRNLAGLDAAEVAALLADVSGATRSRELVESVRAETGGLPGLVVEVGRRLRELEMAARADRALARAEMTRQSWSAIRSDVARGVLARRHLSIGGADGDGVIGVGGCPYKGLAAFGAADAVLFAGRERLVAELVARLAMDHFLAVVGSSGSGKSSLVAAGLFPALASGALPGSERWPCLVIRPGARPMRALASELSPLTNVPIEEVEQQLIRAPTDLDGIVDALLDAQPPGDRLVLVVDQFEEIFTACRDPVARASFVQALTQSPALPKSRLVVAIVMRSDDYSACADFPELARLMGRHQILVSAMTDAELRRAVLEPAWRAGLTVEDGLADKVVEDAAGAPGALPLVSTALLETWVRRSNDTLTLAGYAEAGGVRGAVGRLAEGVYDGLDESGRVIARKIFLRLADPVGERTDVRRQAQRDELAGTDAERAVLADLIDSRLLTATTTTVEVAHEALLREWPRLRGWLEEDREGRRVHRHLADAALAWQSGNRDEGDLYRGVRLHAASDWSASHPGDANPLEAEFLAASEAAQERTLRNARRTAQKLRLLAGGLAALVVLATMIGVLAVSQRSRARHDAALARAQALRADVSRLAELAQTLPVDQHDVALLLGAQGYEMAPSDETAGGLQAALVQTPPQLDRILRYPSATFQPTLDRAGRRLVIGDTHGAAILDVSTGRVTQTMHWPHPREFAEFSSDDSLVAAGGEDGQISIWDAATGRLSGQPLHVGGNICNAVFDPTNRDRVYAVTDTGELTVWDRTDPQHPRRMATWYFTGGADAQSGPGASLVTISPDGRLLAAGPAFGSPTSVWDLETGKRIGSYPGAPGVFGADSATLPIGVDNATALYDVRTGRRITTIAAPGGGSPGAVLSGDGRRLAVTRVVGNIIEVQVYDVATHQPDGAPVRLHHNGAYPVGFLPDGRLVTSGNNEAAIWTIGTTLPPLGVTLRGAVPDLNKTVFLPGSSEVLTTDRRTGAVIGHDDATGASLGPVLSGKIQAPVAPDPRGTLLAATDAHTGVVGIWNLATGKRLAEVPGVDATSQVAWSPDGHRLLTDDGPRLQVWNTVDPAHPRRIASVAIRVDATRPDSLAVTADGRLVLVASSNDKQVMMIDLLARHVLWTRTVDTLSLGQVALSPDGQRVAVDAGDAGKGQLTLYDSATGAPIGSVATQSDGGVAYLHRGAWLVVADGIANPGARLYDSHTLQPIGVAFPNPNAIDYIATNPTGTMFSTAQYGDPLLWNVDPTHWTAGACRIAGRNLTQAEWHQHLPDRPYHRTCPQWPTGL